MNRWLRITLLIMLLPMMWACHKTQTDARTLAVAIAPDAGLLKQLVEPGTNVVVLIPAGMEPHAFEPTPGVITELAQAAIYFQLGMPFEDAMLKKVRDLNPKMQVVDLRKGITLRQNDEPVMELKGIGPGDDDHEAGQDPHIWLSPALLKIQAKAMTEALIALDPAHTENYRNRLNDLTQKLNETSAQIRQTLAFLPKREILVFHPAWGYFCDEFQIRQIPIEIHGKSPSARELGQVIEYAQTENIKVVFAEQQFSTKEAQTVSSALGGKVVMLDPMVEDVISNLKSLATTINEATQK